jgi:hypothetical protein
MKLRDEKWNECTACHRRTTIAQEESYGCDECKKPIDDQLNSKNTRHRDFLEVKIFRHVETTGHADRLHFCSWDCVFKYLPKIKTDYFVEMPFLNYEAGWKGTTAKDFFKALRARLK